MAVRAYAHAFLGGLDMADRDFPAAERHCRRLCRSRPSSACTPWPASRGASSHSPPSRKVASTRAAAVSRLPSTSSRWSTTWVDVAFLLAHAAVLAAAEGRAADATGARALSDVLMARLGLAHWHVFEGARLAVRATGSEHGRSGDHAETADAHPWDVLQATLAMPTPTSGSAMAPTPESQTSP